MSQTTTTTTRSHAVFKAACDIIPLEMPVPDEQPVEALARPPVMGRGKGATLTDVDGNEYIDYCCADGALLLGHADERAVVAVNKAVSKGLGLGSPSEGEVRLVELLASRCPAIEMGRLFNTRLEAVTCAVLLAREHTGRRHIVEFKGSPSGTPNALVTQYNKLGAVANLFKSRADTIAAVLVEPVAVGAGVVPPAEGFLSGLRELCDAHGALLIYDESVIGLRFGASGQEGLFGVQPDLTVLGPVIGGGLPLTVCGGRREVMRTTLGAMLTAGMPGGASVNEVAIAAGIATLHAVGDDGFYKDLEARSAKLGDALNTASVDSAAPLRFTRVGSILGATLAATTGPTRSVSASKKKEHERQVTRRFYGAMLDEGILLARRPCGGMFVSAAHTDEHVDRTTAAARNVLGMIALM
ncbi:MAG: aspartate aminotransferase family protein [Phycisphaerae bacterium]